VTLLERLRAVIARDERAVLFTVVEGDGIGAKLLVLESGEAHGDAAAEIGARAAELLREGRNRLFEHGPAKVFAEVYGPPPRLLVFGAVDTAEALCRAAKTIGWRTIVADARAKFATRARVPSADELVVAWPEEALARVAPDYATAIVVLTHEEKFDVPALRGALATEAFYVGAMGSRRAQARRREHLLAAGVGDDDLERIHGPCGLDLGAEAPAETALSILAEIVAVRNGRTGGPLREAAGPIHVEAPA
jgi:xanthine dehydrogenase accessory factor